MAEERPAARLAGDRRGRRLFVVLRGRRQALHAWRARRHRVRHGVRRGHGQEAVGSRQWPPVWQRSRRRAARHTDGGWRPRLRLRRQRRPRRSRGRDRKAGVESERAREVRRLEHPVGPLRITARPPGSRDRQRRRTGGLGCGAQPKGRLAVVEDGRRRGRVFVGDPARMGRRAAGDRLHGSWWDGR